MQKKYQGYPCNGELCNDNNYLCIYQEQQLCEDIQNDDQREDICKPKEERDKYMNDPKAIIYIMMRFANVTIVNAFLRNRH